MRRFLLATTATLLWSTLAGAQIQNGGFESGSSWALGGDAAISAAGGITGGYAYVGQGVGTVAGTVAQSFNCTGSGSVCEIHFWYRILHPLSGSATLAVKVDGQTKLTVSAPVGPWTEGVVTAPCGGHTLVFDVDVTSGTVCLDDVSASCVSGVPVEINTWGMIKRLFR